ncbi:MAG: SDR family NAD(P)-dependent oxidoreductase [Halioglobus sp.]|nr:SDR family NAD(P)-dependent oxidoreductase [Halioglobus sp.]
MTYIIVGGSSGLGRALAEKFASQGCELVLVSRDIRDTAALAADIAIRHGVKVSPVAMDLGCSPLTFDAIDRVLSDHLPLKGLLLPAGINDDDDEVGLGAEKLGFITRVNYLAPCELLNHYLPLLVANYGIIVGFGSVATARGRTRNAAYAAAKNALASYFESLAHYGADRGISCQYYILGYLDTNLAFSQNLLFPRAAPDRVANVVYSKRLTNGTYFLPRLWYILYRVIQFLPWAIFKRLTF